jgi:hypothetical protein
VTVLTPTPSPELDPAPAPKLSPTPSPAPAGDVDWKAQYDELLEHSEGMAATLEAMSAEYDRMTAVVDADDKLKAALARIKQLEELVAAMERRNWGLMAEKNDVIRTAKHFKRMAERYRRQSRLCSNQLHLIFSWPGMTRTTCPPPICTDLRTSFPRNGRLARMKQSSLIGQWIGV